MSVHFGIVATGCGETVVYQACGFDITTIGCGKTMVWQTCSFCIATIVTLSITGPLPGESTYHCWIPFTKGQWCRALSTERVVSVFQLLNVRNPWCTKPAATPASRPVWSPRARSTVWRRARRAASAPTTWCWTEPRVSHPISAAVRW